MNIAHLVPKDKSLYDGDELTFWIHDTAFEVVLTREGDNIDVTINDIANDNHVQTLVLELNND